MQKKGSRFVKLIRITAETLSGIPSIVYGLFGMLFFVTALHWGMSLLSGALTMVIMVLPLIMRTAEEALIAVPDSYREGSFGLGAGRLRTVFRIVLPAAGPGILSGVILGIGRIVGETAALIFTAGTMAQIPGLFQSGRTLAIHMYVLSGEALHMNEANATAVVLLLVVLLMNMLSALAAKKLTRSKGRMNMENKIEIHNMNLHYGDFHALKTINLDLPANQITAFIGPSGCGKSTLVAPFSVWLQPQRVRSCSMERALWAFPAGSRSICIGICSWCFRILILH